MSSSQQLFIKFPQASIALYRLAAKSTNKLQFRVPPSMTKPELKEYLSAIYGLNAVAINTTNPMRRVPGVRKAERPGVGRGELFKKAMVTLDSFVQITAPPPIPERKPGAAPQPQQDEKKKE
jgi:ribosomal protein L23